MLTVYVRHAADCAKVNDRFWKRCRCPKWLVGTVGGKLIRRSAKTRSWERAEEKKRELEAEDSPQPKPRVTVAEAVKEFKTNAELVRKLRPPTLKKYRVLFDQLQKYCDQAGIDFISEIDLTTLSRFQTIWKDGALAARKKQERLRGFFRFLYRRKWIMENPAIELETVKVDGEIPTLPFEPEEMDAILRAVDEYEEKSSPWDRAGTYHVGRVRAFILTLRWSGLRIGDACKLTADKLNGNKLYLHQTKSRKPVWIPLPPEVAAELNKLPTLRGYFFWTGAGKVDTAAGNWRRTLRRVFKMAKVQNGHPHRFRDTFACYLLERNVSLEEVSMLLGHSSVKITEKYYAPWVKVRQERLEENVMRAWEQDRKMRVIRGGKKERA